MGTKRTIPATHNGAGLEILNTAVSSTTTYTSTTFDAKFLDNVGLQVAFTGTMSGTLTVNASIDNVNFLPLTFSPGLTQPSGSALSYLVNLTQIPYPYVQVSYTNASGSGTLTVFLSAKDLN